jgi:plasmid stability protein
VHAVVLALALLAVVCLPAVVAGMLYADEFLDRQLRRVAARLQARRQRRTINQLDRSMKSLARDIDLAKLDSENRPAIEQIAADLHRLGGQRLNLATRSQVWHSAVLQAYDDRLRLASRCLGVAEHLGDLEGVDLEIERIRVEGELQAAGLILPTAPADRRPEQR